MTATQTPGRGAPPGDVNPTVPATAARTSHELVLRAQNGDRDAFAQLYLQHRDFIYIYLYRRLKHRQTAEDFTSETFMKALRSINRFTWQGTDIKAWLTTIARNVLIDYYKSSRNLFEVINEELTDDRNRADDRRDADPAIAVLDILDAETLRVAIAGLPEAQAICVTLKYLHEMSEHETAAAMGTTMGAVRGLTQRGRGNLAALLSREATDAAA